MNTQIAVLLDENGQTVSTNNLGIVRIYSKENGSWNSSKDIVFNLSKDEKLTLSNQKLVELKELLGDCNIFAARKVLGLTRTVLSSEVSKIIEVSGAPEKFLDSLLNSLEQCELEKSEKNNLENSEKETIKNNAFSRYVKHNKRK